LKGWKRQPQMAVAWEYNDYIADIILWAGKFLVRQSCFFLVLRYRAAKGF